MAVFEHFTDEARRVVVLAQASAGRLAHRAIGPEHVMLGVLGVEARPVVEALENLSLRPAEMAAELEAMLGEGRRPMSGHLPFTPDAKDVLEASLGEATRMGRHSVGPEHVMLALLRRPCEPIAEVLARNGLDADRLRNALAVQLAPAGGGVPAAALRTVGDDHIRLAGLRIHARHGVYAEERRHGQWFEVDVEVALDLTEAGRSDDLADTIDYGELARTVHDVVAGEQWQLIERVATRVAEVVLDHDPRIARVVVAVHKPEAPMPVEVADTIVTVTRSR